MDPALIIAVVVVAASAGLIVAAARSRGWFENVNVVVALAGFGFFGLAVLVMGWLPFLRHREDTTVSDVRAPRERIVDFIDLWGESTVGGAGKAVTADSLIRRAQRLARLGLGRFVEKSVVLRSDGPERRLANHRRAISRLNRAAYDYLLSAEDKERLLRDAGGSRTKQQKAIDDLLDPISDRGATKAQIETALTHIDALKPRTDADRRIKAELPALRRLWERFAEFDTNGDGRLFTREGRPESDNPPPIAAADLAEFRDLFARIPGTEIRRTRTADFEWRVVKDGRTYTFEQAVGRFSADRPPDARTGMAAVDANFDGVLTADEILALAERKRFDGRVLLAELMRWDFEGDGELSEIEVLDALNSAKADRESAFLSDDDFAALKTKAAAAVRAAVARHAPRRIQDLAGKAGLAGLPAVDLIFDGATVKVTNLVKIAANGAALPGVLDRLGAVPPVRSVVELAGLDKVHASLYRQLKQLDFDGNDVLDDADLIRLEADFRRRADAVFALTGHSVIREITAGHVLAAFAELDRNRDGSLDEGDFRLQVPPYTFAQQRGREVYIREGCVYCHSQYVRPVAGEDMRWGPVSQRAEYLHDQPHLLGTRRIGPDLARVGGKYADGWHWAHHLRPRNISPESVMPSFHWLYQSATDPEYVRRAERVRRFIEAYDSPSRKSGVLVNGSNGGVQAEKDGIVTVRLVDSLAGETLDDVAETFNRVWEPYRDGSKSIPVRRDAGEFVFDVAEPAAAALLLDFKELRIAATTQAAALEQLPAQLRKAVDDLFIELDLNGDGVVDAADARRQPTRELIDLTAYLQRLGTAVSIEDWRGEHFSVSAGGGAIADTPEHRAAGKLVYERHCIGCHGAAGDGRGVAAAYLDGAVPDALGDDARYRESLGLPKRDRQPAPRNFRIGRFKFRSTPDGSPPTDDDLFRTVSRGLRGTAMPGFHELPDRDRRLVVNYVKTFSDRFSPVAAGRADGSGNAGSGGIVELALGATVFHGEEFTVAFVGENRWSITGRLDGAVVHTGAAAGGKPAMVADSGMTLTVSGAGFAVGDAFRFTTWSAFHDPRRKPSPRTDAPAAAAPPPSWDLLVRGRQIYHGAEAGCAKCHGEAGRGDGPARRTEPMFDEWGRRAAPADLADIYGVRSGATPEDLYRTLTTGVSGTPMAQFAGALANEYDRWAVVHYVRRLRQLGAAQRYWKSLVPPGTPAEKAGAFNKFKRGIGE